MAGLKSKVAAAALGMIGIAVAPATVAQEIFGRWIVDGGKAVIELLPCGQEACGRIAWLKNPRDETGAPKRDIMNPDPKRRSRFLCGLPLVEGLTRRKDGAWEGGKIYSTRDGGTYGFDVTLIDENSLAVRGYLGIGILGSTRIWRRDHNTERRSCRDTSSGDENRP